MRIVRSAAVACAVALIAGVLHTLAVSAGTRTLTPKSIYVVRPDPRACPSPMCGGYWVALANHARTRCNDGLLRPRCYVAIAISSLTREPVTTELPANGLVKAVLGSQQFGGFGELGALYVTDVWKPVGQEATGGFFRMRDTGVRCVRAPCFSFRVGRLNTSAPSFLISSVDLGPAVDDPRALRRAEDALVTPEGLLVAGRVTATAFGGRLFRASQVYLRAATPRA